MRYIRWSSLLFYVGLIFAANWAVDQWGVVSVGFGMYAPAAVYVVGFSLIARDLCQSALGKTWAILAILVGAGLSALVSPTLALASGLAFLASELVDFSIFTSIHHRSWLGAVAISGALALVVDSLIFLWIAFGNFDFLPGQLYGKAIATAAGVTILVVIRAFLSRDTRAALAQAD